MKREPFYSSWFLFFSRPIATVGGAALILAVFGMLSRILGLIRDRLLASTFGAGDILDVYYASFRIPDFLYGILVLGGLSAAFIPIFSKIYTKGNLDEAWKLTSDFLVFLVGSIAFLACILFLGMPVFIYAVAPGFEGLKLSLTIELTRIMLLSPIILGASAVFGGVLISRRSFFSYATAPIVYNVGIIFGVLVFSKELGPSGLAWGVVLGSFLHFLVQSLSVFRDGYHFQFSFVAPWRNPKIQRILILMIPQIFSIASTQIYFWIITFFASIMTSGSLAVFNFANNFQSIPLALIGVSFAVAAFPKLSASAQEVDMVHFRHIFIHTARRILYFVLPASALLILLRAELVRVVLGSGVFNWEDTTRTFQVLGLLSISLFAQSLLPLAIRAFYSLEDTKTPFFVALFSQIINIILILMTWRLWGVYSLAIAFSVASIIQIVLLFFFLKKYVGGWKNDEDEISFNIMPMIASVVAMAFCVQGMKLFWGTVTNLDTFWEVFTRLTASGLVGVATYALMSHFLNIDEFCDFRKKVYSRLFGKTKTLALIREEEESREM